MIAATRPTTMSSRQHTRSPSYRGSGGSARQNHNQGPTHLRQASPQRRWAPILVLADGRKVTLPAKSIPAEDPDNHDRVPMGKPIDRLWAIWI